VKNNIAIGTPYAGFIAPGDACGATTSRFSGNIGHSIGDSTGKAGYGALIYPHADGGGCYEGSYFTAYKCR